MTAADGLGVAPPPPQVCRRCRPQLGLGVTGPSFVTRWSGSVSNDQHVTPDGLQLLFHAGRLSLRYLSKYK